MKFAFIAKHRGIWPAGWLCGALGVSRGGFYAWLTRPRSERGRSDEGLGAKVRTSFLSSDRTYGARRVWHDVLAEGARCGLEEDAVEEVPVDGCSDSILCRWMTVTDLERPSWSRTVEAVISQGPLPRWCECSR